MRRLFAEYDGKLPGPGGQSKYLIELFHEEYTGADAEVKCGARAMIFHRESNVKDFPHTILPTNLEIEFFCDTQAQLDFFADMATADEAGLWCRVTLRDTGDLFYIGAIVPDLIREADVSIQVGVPVRIRVVDGLARLKDTSYIDSQASVSFNQLNDDGMRAEVIATRIYNQPQVQDRLFTNEIHDNGDRYDTTTGRYTSGYLIANWYASLVIEANPLTDNQRIVGRFVVTKAAGGTDVVAEEAIIFLRQNIQMRESLNVSVDDLFLEEGDTIHFELENFGEWNIVRIEAGGAMWNFVNYTQYTVERVYGTVIDHFQNILQMIGLNQRYAATDDYFRTITTWQLVDNPQTLSPLTLIEVPYNAFVTDYGRHPVKTLDCYECLSYLCLAFGGFITYDRGGYVFYQYDALLDNESINHPFKPDFTPGFIGLSYRYNMQEQCRLSGGSFSYLPSIRELSVSFKRWNSPNFLYGAASLFPNDDNTVFLGNYVKSGESARMIITVEFLNNPPPTPTFAGRVIHGFNFKFKIGNAWMKFDQFTAYQNGLGVVPPGQRFVDTTWEDLETTNTLIFDEVLTSDPPPAGQTLPISRQIVGMKYQDDTVFDMPPESGPIELYLEYERTYYYDVPYFYDEVLDLQWRVVDLQFVNSDQFENIIDETVTTSLTNSNATKNRDFPILFSDEVALDGDPGKIRAIGVDETLPLQMTNGHIKAPYQEFLTKVLFSWLTRRTRTYDGSFVNTTGLPEFGYLVNAQPFFSPKQSYDSVLNHQRGSYVNLSRVLSGDDIMRVVSAGGRNTQGSSSTLPPSNGGTSSTPNPTPVDILGRIITGSSFGDGTDLIVPYNFDLARLDGLTEEEINRQIQVENQGQGLHYPTYVEIDFTADPVPFKFSRPIRSNELITWKIIT